MIGDEEVVTSKNQKFYLPMQGRWVAAKDLLKGSFLVNYSQELVPIQGIYEVEGEIGLYSLSIKKHHNYYVSKHKILVHNEAFTIGFTWAFGGGAIKFLGATEWLVKAKSSTVAVSTGTARNLHRPLVAQTDVTLAGAPVDRNSHFPGKYEIDVNICAHNMKRLFYMCFICVSYVFLIVSHICII